MRAKFKWHALGGKFSGILEPLDIVDTVTGGPECPDDELSQTSDRRRGPGPGVDALRRRNFDIIAWLPPGVVVWDGLWHEGGENLSFQLDEENAISFYLADLDPAARILSREEVLAVESEWDRKFDELLDAVPPDYWISIVDCRAA
jgi:hypothetical protein